MADHDQNMDAVRVQFNEPVEKYLLPTGDRLMRALALDEQEVAVSLHDLIYVGRSGLSR